MKLKLSDQPVAYEKAIKAIVYLLVGFTIVRWTEAQIVLVLAVAESVLGILVWNSVTPNAKVDAKIEEATTAGRNEALAEVASLRHPPRTEPIRADR